MIGGRLFLSFLAAAAAAAACSSGAQPGNDAGKASQASVRPPAALGTDPLKRVFGEELFATDVWLLACDNVRVCRAQPRLSSGSLMIRRDPGPNGLIRVVLDGQDPWEGPSTPDLASLRLAGATAAPDAPWRIDRDAENAVLEGEAALRFIETLLQAQALSYRISGEPAGDEPLEVSLTRLRAVLQAMDEAQGHAGAESAFVRRGSRPRAEVPAAPAVPVIEVAAPSVQPLPAGFAARVRRDNPRLFADCDEAPPVEDEAHPLTAADALAIALCSTGMSGTSSYLLLRVPRTTPGRAERLVLPVIPEVDDSYEDGSALYADLSWDPATRTVSSGFRSCAGGCGENLSWAFDGERFRLLTFTFYEAGGGEPLDLYRVEVRPRR